MELRPHWMVFQVECGNIKKRKAFCLRVTDGNEQHVHSSKEYQNLFCQVSNYNGYDWIGDETVPAGWKSWVIGSSGKEYIFRPDGKQFVTRCIAFQHMVEYIATLGDDNCLPGGWFYRVEKNFNI